MHTTIRIKKGTSEQLKAKKITKHETYDEIIIRLIKEGDKDGKKEEISDQMH